MMPLSMVGTGEENTIQRIGGKEETKKFLETLGFVVGGKVTVVSQTEGNLIVNIKESRVAIGKDMANKIMTARNIKLGTACNRNINSLTAAIVEYYICSVAWNINGINTLT